MGELYINGFLLQTDTAVQLQLINYKETLIAIGKHGQYKSI